MNSLSNDDLFKKLSSTDAIEQEEALTYLYHTLYSTVERYVVKNKGEKEEVKDVFQDTLLAFFKMVKQKKITQIIKIEAYVFSIARNLWLKQLQKKKIQSSEQPETLNIPVEDVLTQKLFTEDKSTLLNKVLKEIGTGCENILLAFYYERQSMAEIVESMGLSNIQIAKNKKYKCLQKLKQLILGSDYYKNKLR